MGIRFLCPNGHKLNVKEYLIGKRGICPQCDAKFLVPSTSGGIAEALAEQPEQPEESAPSPAAQSSSQSPSQSPSPVPPPAPIASTPPPAPNLPVEPEVLWYVRMASGDQFGPANTEVMQGWVAEGRVPADSWVWRTGWGDWKQGGEAVAVLNTPTTSVAEEPVELPPATQNDLIAVSSIEPTTEPIVDRAIDPTAEPASELDAASALAAASVPTPTLPTALVDNIEASSIEAEATGENTSPTVRYQLSKRSRQERARQVTFFLGGVVVLLLAVLVVVLMRK